MQRDEESGELELMVALKLVEVRYTVVDTSLLFRVHLNGKVPTPLKCTHVTYGVTYG